MFFACTDQTPNVFSCLRQCHCEGAKRPSHSQSCQIKKEILKRVQDDKISRLGIPAQQEIPNHVRNDKKLFPRPLWERREFLNERSEFRNSGEGSEPFVNRKPLTRICSSLCSHNCVLSHKGRGMVSSKHFAFTLAEVLITLGIIGIVAAMTIPTLIAKYQKKQTVTKLKQTYSMISQALTMAQAEHGDTTTWDVAGIYGTDTSDPNFNSQEKLITFVQKYFMPYLKVTKDYGLTTYADIDYSGVYDPVSNSNATGHYTKRYIIQLSNDVLISTAIGTTGCLEEDADGNCLRKEYRNMSFNVDINGFKSPNTMGKDVFYIIFNLNSRVVGFHNYGNASRDVYRTWCSRESDAQVCGYLIFLDGWEIKDDYPWL